jgi:ABC-2 type transport system permease protein
VTELTSVRAPATRGLRAPVRTPTRRYWHALGVLTKRNLKVRYSTTKLGYLWTILDPLLMGGVYYFVFGKLMGRGIAGETPYIVFLLVAMLPWQWFNQAVGGASSAFNKESRLIRSVKMPRTLWISSVVVEKGLEFVFSLPVLALFVIIYRLPLASNSYYTIPLAFALQVVVTMGVCMLVAPLTLFYEDLDRVISVFLRVLFYASPVLYSVSRVTASTAPEWVKVLYGMNPLAGIFELYRSVFFPAELDWTHVAQSAIISVIFLVLGIVVFRACERRVLKEL